MNNLTNDIINADNEIILLNIQIADMQNQINQLNTTVAALQSTLSSLIYDIKNKVSKCPQDNPGLEIAIGYDDGYGNGQPNDGVLQND